MRGHKISLCLGIKKLSLNYPQYPLLSGALVVLCKELIFNIPWESKWVASHIKMKKSIKNNWLLSMRPKILILLFLTFFFIDLRFQSITAVTCG